jgi:hypothetical protein
LIAFVSPLVWVLFGCCSGARFPAKRNGIHDGVSQCAHAHARVLVRFLRNFAQVELYIYIQLLLYERATEKEVVDVC